MKHCKFLPAVLILLAAATGCDSVRTVLGKPTSADIEKMRLEKEAAEKVQKDSADKAQAVVEKSIAGTPEKEQRGSAASVKICRYNVIVGAFSDAANADRLAEKLTTAGETVTRISFTNGMTAISVLDTDDFHAACRKLNSMVSEDELPYDCWIYDSSTAKHK